MYYKTDRCGPFLILFNDALFGSGSNELYNKLMPRLSGRHFVNNIFKFISICANDNAIP